MTGVFSPTIASIPGLSQKLREKEEERQAKLDEPFPLSVIVVASDVQQAHSVAALITNQLKEAGFVKPVLKVTDQFEGIVPAKYPSDSTAASVLDSIRQRDPGLFHTPVQVFGMEGQVKRERYTSTLGSKHMAAQVAQYVSDGIEMLIENAFEDISGANQTLVPTASTISKGVVIARKEDN